MDVTRDLTVGLPLLIFPLNLLKSDLRDAPPV